MPKALERTFLGYLRTSLAMSMIGITVSQLLLVPRTSSASPVYILMSKNSRLQHSPTPNTVFGYYVLGKPLACICQGSAMCTLVLGSFRAWRLQNAMVRGKAITGGFEILSIAGGLLLVSIGNRFTKWHS